MSQIDRQTAEQLALNLMRIPGTAGDESAVATYIRTFLETLGGLPTSTISTDTAHRRSPAGGEQGNLVVKLRGTAGRTREPRRLLSAHMDTVPICVGCDPVKRGNFVRSANKDTGLGADDRAGCAAILAALTAIITNNLSHPPLTFLWTVQEEIGLKGARHCTVSKLGKPAMGFNFDGGSPGDIVIGATGASRMAIHIQGIASHAGGHPEDGVSAIAIASLAIAELVKKGWHGTIDQSKKSGKKRKKARRPDEKPGKKQGTANVGIIQAGAATNVVTESATLRAEMRSHHPAFRRRIVDAYIKAFRKAAKRITNDAGACGKVAFDVQDDYESFALGRDEPVVREAVAAIEAMQLTPNPRIINGGLDANWLNAYSIPTATLGVGQHDIHTVKEHLNLKEFHAGCAIALRLAIGAA